MCTTVYNSTLCVQLCTIVQANHVYYCTIVQAHNVYYCVQLYIMCTTVYSSAGLSYVLLCTSVQVQQGDLFCAVLCTKVQGH